MRTNQRKAAHQRARQVAAFDRRLALDIGASLGLIGFCLTRKRSETDAWRGAWPQAPIVALFSKLQILGYNPVLVIYQGGMLGAAGCEWILLKPRFEEIREAKL
jgi:hypothetical protein